LSSPTAAPVDGLEARNNNGLGTPRQIQWLKTTMLKLSRVSSPTSFTHH
jgi:hypothetical protein